MKLFKSALITFSSVGLLFLGACDSDKPASNSSSSPTTSSQETAKSDHPDVSQGGQVVESGDYHLELVTEKEDNGTHLDLYLQRGDNHEAIPNAKVTAQVQLPDGTQKNLDLNYMQRASTMLLYSLKRQPVNIR